MTDHEIADPRLVRVNTRRNASRRLSKEGNRIRFRIDAYANEEKSDAKRSYEARQAWTRLLETCRIRSTEEESNQDVCPSQATCETDVWDVHLPMGLNVALLKLGEGDVAEVELFGRSLLSDVPAELPKGWDEEEASVKFHLEVLKVNPGRGDKFQMSATERWSRADELRIVGNALAKEKRHERAAEVYQEAARFLNIMQMEGDAAHGGVDESARKENQQAMELLVKLWLNYAHVALKEERWKEAETACTEVLDVDPGNAKALYRRGVARTELRDWEEGEKDLNRALKLDPSIHSEVAKSLSRLRQSRREHNLKQMDSMIGMFDRMGELYWDKKKEEPNQPVTKAKIPRRLSASIRRTTTPPVPDSYRVLGLKEALSIAEMRKERHLQEKNTDATCAKTEVIQDLDAELLEIEEEEADQARLDRQAWLNDCIRRKQTI